MLKNLENLISDGNGMERKSDGNVTESDGMDIALNLTSGLRFSEVFMTGISHGLIEEGSCRAEKGGPKFSSPAEDKELESLASVWLSLAGLKVGEMTDKLLENEQPSRIERGGPSLSRPTVGGGLECTTE